MGRPTNCRTETVGAVASAIAAIPAVRAALVAKQHSFRRAPGLVADGRDMGAVIFPDAGTRCSSPPVPRTRAPPL